MKNLRRAAVLSLIVIAVLTALLLGNSSAVSIQQTRESQIVILSGIETEGCAQDIYYALPIYQCGPASSGETAKGALVNPALYPSGTTFTADYGFSVMGGTFCLRLFDAVASAPVAGSEVCRTNDSIELATYERVALPIALSTGPHILAVQAKVHPACDPDVCGMLSTGALLNSRVFARWKATG